MAHELTHTVQQTGRGGSGTPGIQKKEWQEGGSLKKKETFTLYFRDLGQSQIRNYLHALSILIEFNNGTVNVKPDGGRMTNFYSADISFTDWTDSSVMKKFKSEFPLKDGTDSTNKQEVKGIFVTNKNEAKSAVKIIEALLPKGTTFSKLSAHLVSANDYDVKTCIYAMNKNISTVYGGTIKNKDLADQASDSIGVLLNKGYASKTHKLNIKVDISGAKSVIDDVKATHINVATPYTPLIDLVKKTKEEGVFVFPGSIMNGYHSIVLLVNYEKSGATYAIWVDQYGTKSKIQSDSDFEKLLAAFAASNVEYERSREFVNRKKLKLNKKNFTYKKKNLSLYNYEELYKLIKSDKADLKLLEDEAVLWGNKQAEINAKVNEFAMLIPKY